jgi:hypothetical protein
MGEVGRVMKFRLAYGLFAQAPTRSRGFVQAAKANQERISRLTGLHVLRETPDEPNMQTGLLPLYAVAQLLLLVLFAFVSMGGWLHVGWEVVVGWGAAAMVLTRAGQVKGRDAAPWYLFALGIFLDSTGLIVEHLLETVFHQQQSPTLADAFFLGRFVGLASGLALLVYHRSMRERTGDLMPSTFMSALFTVGLGLIAWEFIIWQNNTGQTVSFWKRLVVTAYPLGDLMVIAFLLRLMFGGGARSGSFLLVIGSVCCFLGADIGWAVILRGGLHPSQSTQRLLELCSMGGFALMGAGAAHGSMRELAFTHDRGARPTPAVWAALAVSALSAPTVLALEALVNRLYGGGQ